MMFGGNFTRVINWLDDWFTVQDVNLGFNTTFDPAESMFNATNGPINFPGSSTADRTNARALYALLTGRVSSLPGTFALNEAGTEYQYNGHSIQRERMDEYSFFAQDQWRWKPTITVTAGLRYELQYPIVPTNGVFTSTGRRRRVRSVRPGLRAGRPVLQHVQPGQPAESDVVPQFVAMKRATRATRWTTTTSRRTSVSHGGRTCRAASCAAFSATPRWRRSARASPAATTASAWTGSSRSSAATRARRSTRTRTRAPASRSFRPARAGRFCCVRRAA
jgi:outer membrane receptor protein involved in Fe transport